jgi:hypothetical protein
VIAAFALFGWLFAGAALAVATSFVGFNRQTEEPHPLAVLAALAVLVAVSVTGGAIFA